MPIIISKNGKDARNKNRNEFKPKPEFITWHNENVYLGWLGKL